MTAQPHGPGPQSIPERTPKAVRAALPADDRAHFDRDYRAAMARATDELDLAPIYACIDHWRHTAVLKATGEYDAILATAEQVTARVERGEPTGGRPWDDKAKARFQARIERGE